MSNQEVSQKSYTLIEIEELAKKQNRILVILFEGVYDLTKFAQVHPGGDQILRQNSGKNATQKFVQAGHLTKGSIITTMANFRIGKFLDLQKLGKL